MTVLNVDDTYPKVYVSVVTRSKHSKLTSCTTLGYLVVHGTF